MVPRVNITLAVKSIDLEPTIDPGGTSTTSPSKPEIMEWALPPSDPWNSPAQLTFAVLLIFVLSAAIIVCNSLLLVAVYRFKRLRNPSNYFVASLASADILIGVLLAPSLYFEFYRVHVRCVLLCLLPYCLFILLCSVALLSLTAVAVDRCTSLASPLKYNNIITHGSVVRYIALFWIYSLMVSSFPMLYWFSARGTYTIQNCSFMTVVLWPSRVFLFTVLFVPCALLIIFSYGYVYIVARSHARAIFSAELSFRQHPLSGPKYGRTLAGTVGIFCLLWMPFQVVAFTDSLDEKTIFYLGLLTVANAATDPWMYGYRSTEFRIASIRLLETTFPQLKGALHKPQVRHASFASCASHMRMGLTPNHLTHTEATMCATFIEIPILARSLDETAVAEV